MISGRPAGPAGTLLETKERGSSPCWEDVYLSYSILTDKVASKLTMELRTLNKEHTIPPLLRGEEAAVKADNLH